MSAPSAWHLEQTVATLQSLRARLEAEGDTETLEAIGVAEDDVDAMLRRVITAALDAEMLADTAKLRLEALRERRERFQRKAETLRGVAFAIMDACGKTTFADAEFTASIRRGSPTVIITDEAAIPDEYWKVERKIDRTKLNSDAKSGVVIPGATLTNALPAIALRTR